MSSSIQSSPDDGADPEAGVLGLQLEDGGVDGGVVVEDVLLLYQLLLLLLSHLLLLLLLLLLLHDDSGGTAGVNWGHTAITSPGLFKLGNWILS